MAYRYDSNPPKKPENMLQKFAVRNGATLKLAFRCYYFKPPLGHDPHYHDHINWPAPNYHGDACQMKPPRDEFPYINGIIRRCDDLPPIHLLDEGYQDVAVTFEDADQASNITVESWIDEDDDNIVRVHMDTAFPTFSDKPIDLRFTVFVRKTYTDPATNITRTTKDAVAHCFVSVLPGAPYPTS